MGANFGEYLDFKQYPFLLMMLLDTDTNGACDKMYAITVQLPNALPGGLSSLTYMRPMLITHGNNKLNLWFMNDIADASISSFKMYGNNQYLVRIDVDYDFECNNNQWVVWEGNSYNNAIGKTAQVEISALGRECYNVNCDFYGIS